MFAFRVHICCFGVNSLPSITTTYENVSLFNSNSELFSQKRIPIFQNEERCQESGDGTNHNVPARHLADGISLPFGQTGNDHRILAYLFLDAILFDRLPYFSGLKHALMDGVIYGITVRKSRKQKGPCTGTLQYFLHNPHCFSKVAGDEKRRLLDGVVDFDESARLLFHHDVVRDRIFIQCQNSFQRVIEFAALFGAAGR